LIYFYNYLLLGKHNMNLFNKFSSKETVRLLLLSLIFFSTLYSSNVQGATYYMRADGTASNYSEAISPDSASTSMNVATFNSPYTGSYPAGTIIKMSSLGGDYTSKLQLPGTNASGFLTNVEGEENLPVIDISGATMCIQTTADGWEVSNIICDASDSSEAGIYTTGDISLNNMTITGGTNRAILSGGNAWVTIDNCTVIGGSAGIRLTSSGTNSITDTIVYGSYGPGLQLYFGTTIVARVKVYNNSYGIKCYLNSTTTITDSLVYNNTYDGVDTYENAVLTCTNVISHSNGTVNLVSSGDGFSAHSTSVFNMINCIGHSNIRAGVAHVQNSTGIIYNCTFYNNYNAKNTGFWGREHGVGIRVTLDESGYFIIKNNICMANGTEIALDGGSIISDNNLFYSSRGGDYPYYWSRYYTSLSEYYTASGQDSNSRDIDPKFMDVENGDFTLEEGSPASYGAEHIEEYEDRLWPSCVWPNGVFTVKDILSIGAYSGSGLVTLDTDKDTVPDSSDNCPFLCNLNQLDSDSDGMGDVCDASPGCGGVSCGVPQPECEESCGGGCGG
jgi:hypothetical protein